MTKYSGVACAIALAFLAPAGMSAADATDGKYTGPGSCGSTSCHGGVRPRTDNAVLQNEYTTWTLHDKHGKATSLLTNEVGTRMGKILGIVPSQSQRCLVCHSLNVPEDQKTRSFDTGDGVSCEACHGPASNWLGPHTTRGWQYEKSLSLGMTDLRDPVKRTENCLRCHMGDSTRSVDHELIAAGHPDLYFELNSFTAVMPKHWEEQNKDPFYDLRLLATGQGVALRENLKRISRNASKFWPEYAELDCFACHHSLVGARDSWRQARGYPDHRPGNPPWNSSRYSVFRVILGTVDSGAASRLEAGLKRVDDLVSDIRANPAQISQAADAAAATADEIAKQMPKLQLDGAAGLKVIKAITNNADRISGAGERCAEQAAMVLDSLFVASNGGAKVNNGAQIGAAITALFPLVENPSAYNPNSFATQMKRVGALVP